MTNIKSQSTSKTAFSQYTKRIFSACVFTLTLSVGAAFPAFAQGINLHIDKTGIDIQPDQFVSYYQSPPDRLSWLVEQNIPQQQWPLLFEIARAANVPLEQVWDVRRQRGNWNDVLGYFNVSSILFFTTTLLSTSS